MPLGTSPKLKDRLGGLPARLRRGWAIWRLTRKYYRPAQVPNPCRYYLNRLGYEVEGPNALSLMLETCWHDVYGLRRFSELATILDIGANIGTFALHAISRHPRGRVVAFEPCAQLMPYLRKNLAPTPVEVLGEAVGARTQTAQLQLGADLTAATVVPAAPAGDAHGQTCRMVGFDEVVAQLAQPISFLKLDCEGSEYEVFATAALEQVWQVAAELHSVAGQNPQTGLGMLQRRGFVIEAWRPFPGGAAGIVWARNTRWPARVGRP